jgi:hypothetical protein
MNENLGFLPLAKPYIGDDLGFTGYDQVGQDPSRLRLLQISILCSTLIFLSSKDASKMVPPFKCKPINRVNVNTSWATLVLWSVSPSRGRKTKSLEFFSIVA